MLPRRLLHRLSLALLLRREHLGRPRRASALRDGGRRIKPSRQSSQHSRAVVFTDRRRRRRNDRNSRIDRTTVRVLLRQDGRAFAPSFIIAVLLLLCLLCAYFLITTTYRMYERIHFMKMKSKMWWYHKKTPQKHSFTKRCAHTLRALLCPTRTPRDVTASSLLTRRRGVVVVLLCARERRRGVPSFLDPKTLKTKTHHHHHHHRPILDNNAPR